MQARRIDSNTTIYANGWRNVPTTGLARRVEFQTSIVQVDTAKCFERQTFNTSTSMDLALVRAVSNTYLISSFRRHKARRDRARTNLDPSITKASKIRRQVFDGNPRTIGPWLAFISVHIATCNAQYRWHRNSVLSRWSISNVAWLYALAEFRMWHAKNCSFTEKKIIQVYQCINYDIGILLHGVVKGNGTKEK